MPLQGAAVWTGFILSTIVLPPLIPVIVDIAGRRPGVTLHSHFRALRAEFGLGLVQSGLMVIFLAHQAWLMGDAILRTVVRLTIARRRLSSNGCQRPTRRSAVVRAFGASTEAWLGR